MYTHMYAQALQVDNDAARAQTVETKQPPLCPHVLLLPLLLLVLVPAVLMRSPTLRPWVSM
jgi:hypothetical protein